jgi:hypothetical protein
LTGGAVFAIFPVPWWAFQVSYRCGSYKQPRQQHHRLRHNQPTKKHSPTIFLHQYIINLPVEICRAFFLVEVPTARGVDLLPLVGAAFFLAMVLDLTPTTRCFGLEKIGFIGGGFCLTAFALELAMFKRVLGDG